jgi:hypothetical protein
MKNLNSLFAAAAVVVMSGAAHAAPLADPGSTGKAGSIRTFDFKATQINDGDHQDRNFQSGQTIQASSTTNVDVEPYILVQGSFGGNWKLNGWDNNQSDVQKSTLRVYHNADFTMTGSNFGNPVDSAGNQLGLRISIKANTIKADYGLFYPEVDASALNSVIDMPLQTETLGLVDYTFRQKLTAPTSSPAGEYTITPTITFQSNAS